ncbi:MAG: ShlB/FhaC/HecB family hemolysin secretion/activation protein [Synechococcales cyanobacterium RM1_1_8]|nr:ShlB/FhaC/HecB family hemolysin secretion/activation protein [Synechococcales cyanobacterium RM1_1_8]
MLLLAQTTIPDLPSDRPNFPGLPLPTPEQNLKPLEPLPDEPLPELPPADEILPLPSPSLPGEQTGEGPATVTVTGYKVEGSTVFDAQELAKITAPFLGEVTFSDLLQARSAVTKLYVDRGYVTSGAFIPPQTLDSGIVTIQVLEGKLEDVRINGSQRLHPHYVRTRLARAGAEPLNVQVLLEGLKLLQLDPLLSSISADLQAGIEPGTSLLDVTVTEADPFRATLAIDNGRSPSVGSIRRKVSFSHANVLGIGDGFDLSYSNTEGSNALDLSYSVPLNARNGSLRFAYGRTRSRVLEDPFQPLDIQAKSIYYEGTYRQPLYQTASEEFALGLTFSRQESSTKLGFSDIGGFPLSPGANENGETKISALRFFQEWNKRSSQQVLAARSQLSLGTNWFESNQSSDGGPDSNFLTWRGQGQWVRLLAPETLMLVRGDLQFADRDLVPLEQFGIGGQSSVRGYRQDSLLTDNGLLLSAEVRLPIARIPSWDAVLQVAPFFDLGHGWNKDGNNQPDKKTLTGTGLGLIWRQGNNFSARLDWGIPLVDVGNENDTLQEKGIYFSVNYNPF